jgi:hypothetical protein
VADTLQRVRLRHTKVWHGVRNVKELKIRAIQWVLGTKSGVIAIHT